MEGTSAIVLCSTFPPSSWDKKNTIECDKSHYRTSSGQFFTKFIFFNLSLVFWTRPVCYLTYFVKMRLIHILYNLKTGLNLSCFFSLTFSVKVTLRRLRVEKPGTNSIKCLQTCKSLNREFLINANILLFKNPVTYIVGSRGVDS